MNNDTHFFVWYAYRMACGKRPNEIYTFASFWKYVNCKDCIEARLPEHKDVE